MIPVHIYTTLNGGSNGDSESVTTTPITDTWIPICLFYFK